MATLYMSAEERLGYLSPDEQALLDEMNASPMTLFRVTAAIGGLPGEHINIVARTSCDAAVQAVKLMFVDAADDCITTGFKVKVEPVRVVTAAHNEAA